MMHNGLYQKGDKVVLVYHLVEGIPPGAVFDVIRDQENLGGYIQVSYHNGIFRQGFAVDPSHVTPHLSQDDDIAAFNAQTEYESSISPAYAVGDWVKLKAGTPFDDEWWVKHPGEITGVCVADPVWYTVRSVDGIEGWYTEEVLVPVGEHVPDALEAAHPTPPDNEHWTGLATIQFDGTIAEFAVVPNDADGTVRLWIRSFDRQDDEPDLEFPLTLTYREAMNLAYSMREKALGLPLIIRTGAVA